MRQGRSKQHQNLPRLLTKLHQEWVNKQHTLYDIMITINHR